MPSRLGILSIVVFWLVCMSWLIIREIVPLFRTGEPPAFFTDVIDEVGGTTITWTVLHKGEKIGSGFSTVERRSDRTFVLSSTLIFQKLKILGLVDIKKIAGSYRVDLDGNLMELATEVRIGPDGEQKGELKAVVRDGVLNPRIFINEVEPKLGILQPQPLHVAAHGNVLNTMHLLNKVPGLRAGQSWKVPLLDPLGAILPGQKMTTASLIAEVSAADLAWQGQPVPCFRIDYTEPGHAPTAHTWVRRADGLVLQQEAKRDAMDLVLVRESNK